MRYVGLLAAALVLALAPREAALRAEEPCPCTEPATGEYDPCHPIEFPELEQHRWYVQSGAVVMLRDVRGSVDVASLGTGPATILLNTQNLDQSFRPGARVLVGRSIGETPLAVEASFFSLGAWDADVAVRNLSDNGQGATGNMYSPFTEFGQPPVAGVDYNKFVSIHEYSDLDNGEINFRCLLPTPPGRVTASWLIGARYLRINERFNYLSQSAVPVGPGSTARVDTDVGNELWGPQIGAMAQVFVEDGWWVDVELKGAICSDAARQETVFNGVTGGVAQTADFGKSASETVYLGDLNVSLVYRWSPHFSTRIGYQALWLDGLALGSHNFRQPLDILANGPAVLKHDGNVVYHGVHAGLELAW